ncbi:hypothetical protein V2G26_003746 [Clonostachys chloroleuca]
MKIYARPEKQVLVTQAFDAHAPTAKDSEVQTSPEANTRSFSAPVTRGLASEDATSTARVSATQKTSVRAVLIEEPRDNPTNLTHRKTYVFAPVSAAAPGIVTSAVVTILWIHKYPYDFESEFDTDYTSSPNSSSTSSLSLSSTAQTEIVPPDDDFAESLLSNWEISDNGFDTDTGTSDLEEDVGFSDSGDEVLTPRS